MSVEMIKNLSAKHRRTYHIQDDLHEKVKAYAYWERMSVSDVVNTAFKQFLDGWDEDASQEEHKIYRIKTN